MILSLQVNRASQALAAIAARGARVAVVLVDPGYRRLKRSRVSALLSSPPLRWLRRRMIPGMGAIDVADVLDILDDAGVPCWLVGGWGVDALVGYQTRRHADVDVALEPRFLEPAVNALEGAGFLPVEQEGPAAWIEGMVILRDASRRRVELMLVDISGAPPGEEGRPVVSFFRYTAASITTGTIDGRTVACLAAPVQLTLHSNYAPRDSDRHDVRVLVENCQLPAQAAHP
jgi:lincosamide nucleotidyltransferase A/C/D/E